MSAIPQERLGIECNRPIDDQLGIECNGGQSATPRGTPSRRWGPN
jgi:hypothetical protein